MANYDCGFCDLLYNCGAGISNEKDYFTFSSKMLCEIADGLGGITTFLIVGNGGSFYSTGLDTPITDTTVTELVADPGPGLRLYVQNGLISNTSLVSTVVQVKSGTNVLFEGIVGANSNLRIAGLLAANFNESITIQALTSGASILASVTGYTLPV